MSIRDHKITDAQIAEKGVIASPDTLTGTADENKRVFDRLVRECVAPQFNEIVETFADMEESTTEWSGEEAKRQQAEQGRVSAETARMTAENDRADAETARAAAETARVLAENLRAEAETARANAENKRDTAEKSRASAETGRVNAESARVTAESQRANAESVRAQNEAARISAETGRADAEADRVSAEDTRIANENARKSAETDRASAETVRESGENARKSAEKARASAEQQRESAESTRQTNETARVNAEKSRAAAETARQTAEKARNVWEEYNPDKAYIPGNKVSFNGSSYLCTAPTTGHAPTDTTYWLLIAKKGEDGKGAGDMLASVYDPKGMAQDVFHYADAKASAAKSVADTAQTGLNAHIASKSNPHGVTAPQVGADPIGTAARAVSTHNTSASAHSALFAAKQDKITGKKGQFVGFAADNVPGAVDAPSGGVNPNLLDNWYFGRPVNQRGQTEYTAGGAYTLDRWWAQYDTTLSIVDGGIKIGGKWDVQQYFETTLPNATYTLSLLYKDRTGSDPLRLLIGNRTDGDLAQTESKDASGILSVTFSTAKLNKVNFGFTGSTDNSATIIAIKLELGDTQTLAHQDSSGNWILNEIPDFGEQLRRCQRYLFSARGTTNYVCAGSGYISVDGTEAIIVVPTPISLRATPVCMVNGILHVDTSYGEYVTGNNVSLLNVGNGSLGIRMKIIGSATPKSPCFMWIDINNNLLFSADL